MNELMHVMQEQIDTCNASIEPVPYLFDKKWKYSTSLRVDDSGNDSWQVGWPRRFSILILNGVVCDQRAFLPQSWWKVTKGLLYLETGVVCDLRASLPWSLTKETKGLLYLETRAVCNLRASLPRSWWKATKGLFYLEIGTVCDLRASLPWNWSCLWPKVFSTSILTKGNQRASLPWKWSCLQPKGFSTSILSCWNVDQRFSLLRSGVVEMLIKGLLYFDLLLKCRSKVFSTSIWSCWNVNQRSSLLRSGVVEMSTNGLLYFNLKLLTTNCQNLGLDFNDECFVVPLLLGWVIFICSFLIWTLSRKF